MKGMGLVKRIRQLGMAVLCGALLASCGPVEDAGFTSDVERELDRARSHAAALVAGSAEAPTVAQAVAVGYLERHRLGLGSPFRLIEYALLDPRLEPAEREALAWSLLAATLEGAGYQIDPYELAVDGDVEAASRHLELVEGAVQGAPDPDGAVLAVRLAYAMAAGEARVSPRLPLRVSQVTALVRDRAVARADAQRLLRAAGNRHDPLSLVTVWRVERRFQVEAPTLLPVAGPVEEAAITLAPRLLEGIRSIADRPRVGPLLPAPEPRVRPVLSPEAARVLALEAAAHDTPPQTPITVGLAPYRNSGTRTARTSDARDHFFDAAVNEERLAAEYAVLHHRGSVTASVRFGLLTAAVGMRAYAQERPWFPDFGGPARRDLEERFGLASVTFPESVPAAWRPYYRRMLESALSDLQRVLPALDLRGLHVRFGSREGSPGTLAVHDPATRTVHIPAATGAGTLAHEFAHDLDWQTALRRYRVRGDYGTDRAMRLADQRLTRVLEGLTAATIPPDASSELLRSHSTRPAEVFARSMDWFVAVALAREGRVNGYLSSVQDDMLTGYGTVTAPDVSGTAGQALISLLDEVAPVYPETRRWFLDSYGRRRAPTAYDLARRVLEAPLGSGRADTAVLAPHPAGPVVDTLHGGEVHAEELEEGVAPDSAFVMPRPVLERLAHLEERLDQLRAARDSALAMVTEGCPSFGYGARTAAARVSLVEMVARARARGLALDAAREAAGEDGRLWMDDRLRGRGPAVELQPGIAAALEPLVERVRDTAPPTPGAGPLTVPSSDDACVGLPLR